MTTQTQHRISRDEAQSMLADLVHRLNAGDEVIICFLEARYLRDRDQYDNLNSPISEQDVERACGVLKASRGVTLEEMDAAIRKRGGTL